MVRIQPNHIAFGTIDALDDIYGHSTKSNKGESYQITIQKSKYPRSIVQELFSTLQLSI